MQSKTKEVHTLLSYIYNWFAGLDNSRNCFEIYTYLRLNILNFFIFYLY